MENAIVVGIIIVLIIVGARSAAKHLKGEGGCCGGGNSVKIKPKKLKYVIKEKTVLIEGMTCEHCKNCVESRLNELGGVSAKVYLKSNTAVISMEKEISDEKIKEVIEKAGYHVMNMD